MYDNPKIPPGDTLSIKSYATLAQQSIHLKSSSSSPLDTPMLGFFGEAGSLLSAVKKQKRDGLPTRKYFDTVREEVGDFLWYFSLVCQVSGVPLETVAERAAKIAIHGSGELQFIDLDRQFALRTRPPIDRLVAQLIALAGDVGKFADWYAHNRREPESKVVEGHLSPILRHLVRACAAAGITLQDAAKFNLYKTYDRWPPDRDLYPDLYDEHHEEITERLPRRLEIRIEQRTRRNKTYVFQTCRELNIGDPLTDNIRDADYYRFHDVFHYAYAAILGWSPVTRALFKLKRKSDPRLDENEDGARAILIEEGLSTIIFNHAKAQRFFEGVRRGELSFDLLKTVQEFVRGYEVDSAPLWLWEEAILAGFKCFRFLRERKAGLVTLDMDTRTITIDEIPK